MGKKPLTDTQQHFLKDYHALIQDLEHLPSEEELAQATLRSKTALHSILNYVRKAGHDVPTRGKDYWKHLLSEVNRLKAELHEANNRLTVLSNTVELVQDWLQRADELYDVGVDSEWSSVVEGRAELAEILGVCDG